MQIWNIFRWNFFRILTEINEDPEYIRPFPVKIYSKSNQKNIEPKSHNKNKESIF